MSDLDGQSAHTALRDAAVRILAAHDLVLEEIVVTGPRSMPEVRVIVDRPEDQLGSADLDVVATASRELSALVDEDDDLLGPDPVVLEVTTPGSTASSPSRVTSVALAAACSPSAQTAPIIAPASSPSRGMTSSCCVRSPAATIAGVR